MNKTTRSLLSLALSAGLAASLERPASAQFTDGDLLVRSLGTGTDVLYRIDPLTGTGTALIDQLYNGYSKGGWMAYDSYRDAVLGYTSYAPFGLFRPRLLVVRADGNFADVGYHDAAISALAPVGDGRVYCMRSGVLNLLDEASQLSPVPDDLGMPVTTPTEFMVYDAPTNALIGVSRTSAAGAPCASFTDVSIHRFPLNATGDALSGPVVCAGLTVQSTSPIGLDRLPTGEILLAFADRKQFQSNQLWAIDPATLTGTVWATPNYGDLDGGFYCQALDRAVVHDDVANALRTFDQNEVGAGGLLATSVPVGGSTTGTNTTNYSADVNVLGTTCPGVVHDYGAGLAGTSGVPRLGVTTCPTLGKGLPITVSSARAGSTAYFVFGTATASISVAGGTLFVAPPFFAQVARPIDTNGFAQVLQTLPNFPALAGVPFFVQAAIVDPLAVKGWAMSQPTEIQAF